MKTMKRKQARKKETRRQGNSATRPLALYHFTSLTHLPDILSDGITRGEIPAMELPYSERPQAANLTSDPTLTGQQCWTQSGILDKTRVRLSVKVPKSDVFTFRRAMKRFSIPRNLLKFLAPNREEKHWYFSRTGISPKQIHLVEVALTRHGEFVRLNAAEVASLVEWINDAKSRLNIEDDGKQVLIRIRPFDWTSPLLDGPQSLKPNGYPKVPESAIRSPSIETC